MADEVVLYNRDLSAAEIQTLANMPGAMLGSTHCPPVEKSRISLGGPFLFPVAQGRSVQVEIRLSDPAPAGGATISLTSTDPAALTVPASVFIPEGSVNTFFDATTILSVPPSTIFSARYHRYRRFGHGENDGRYSSGIRRSCCIEPGCTADGQYSSKLLVRTSRLQITARSRPAVTARRDLDIAGPDSFQ